MDPMNQLDQLDQLDGRARDVLARYKAEIGPSPQDVSTSWQAIAAQATAEGEVAIATQQRRSVAWRGFAVGVLVATAAAAVLVWWAKPWGSAATVDPDEHAAAQYEGRERAEGGQAIARQPEPAASPFGPPRARHEPSEDGEIGDNGDNGEVFEAQDEDEADLVIEEDAEDEDPVPSRPRRNEPRAPVDPISALAEESALLDRARSALSSGRARDALARVAEHGRRFPRGPMTEEAAAIRVGALCEVGPAKRWHRALTGFDRRYPQSPLRVHLRDDCFSD